VPLGNYFGNVDPSRGLRLTISPWQKSSSRALPSSVKCGGHYANSVLATSDAVVRGFDEALMLNDRGEIAEGSCENVFLIVSGTLVTNDETADILPGITRATVLTLAERLGIPIRISRISVSELMDADEVFLTGTVAEVAAVGEIDGRLYRSCDPDSTTSLIGKAYSAAVRGFAHTDLRWCTYVPY
jgi:branched-chain amino acid aminotransferase